MSSVSSFKDHNSLSERTEFIDNDLSQVQHNQKGNNIHLPKQNLCIGNKMELMSTVLTQLIKVMFQILYSGKKHFFLNG